MDPRAGTPAQPDDLIDVDALRAAFHERVPDADDPAQRVSFGTSGHRGSALTASFNEAHIVAIAAAIAEYRAAQGTTGPLFLGGDTHALSAPAVQVCAEVLTAAGISVLACADGDFVPTPALSHAILTHNRNRTDDLADGIVVTPSHNPPADGGIKYNPPHGGPADTAATAWIEQRANDLLRDWRSVPRDDVPAVGYYDFLDGYVSDLDTVIHLDAIRTSGLRLAAHPLGGAAEAYWRAIADRYDLPLTVLGAGVDPTWGFMTLDWDGKIRMDPSSRYAMAGVLEYRHQFDLVTGNDADADRHGIVTADGGLMNPNQFLAVCVDYLLTHRPEWPAQGAIGKTAVSSALIDRVVAAHGRQLLEVPVGFKWFVEGLSTGSVVFGGEESAGASFLTRDGQAWSTDKDGIILALLAAEIWAVTGQSPSERYAALTERFGAPAYARTDAPATVEQKARLAALTTDDILDTELAGDPIVRVSTTADGNGAALGGVVIRTEQAWCAIRPSGTEAVMKVYAESFGGPEHLQRVQQDATALLRRALDGSAPEEENQTP